MYTVSGGYYLDGTSFNQKKSKSRKTGRVSKLQLTIFLTLFILSFVFGAVMQVYATNDEILTTPSATDELSQSVMLYEIHIVDSGQSLWTIARQYAPAHVDVREYVNEIQILNQLDTNVLFLGQRLLLPSIS